MPFSFYIRDDAKDLNKECRIYLQYTYAGKKWRNPATFKGGDPIKAICKNFIKKRELEKLRNSRKAKSGDRPQRLILDGNKRTIIINQQLDKLEEKARNIILYLQQTGSPTVERFKEEWDLAEGKSRVFGVFDKYISLKREQGKSESTLSNLRKLKLRLQKFNQDIRFNHFDLAFWGKYMDAHIEYSINTMSLDQNNLKAFLSWSRGKYHDNDAFLNWKGIKRVSREVYLTPDELLRIESFKDYKMEKDEAIKDIFLWLCHSGMRFNEFTQLSPDSMEGEVISYRRLKQGDNKNTLNKIILSPTLKRIWNKYGGEFPKISMVFVNRRIKEIAKLTGIEKNLSTSVGRHTFASLMEEFGVDDYTTSKTLGHASTETTRRNYQHSVKVNEGAVLFDMHLRKREA